MNRLVKAVLDLLYPPRCALCRRLLRADEDGICRFCRIKLPALAPDTPRRAVKNTVFCVVPLRYEGMVRDSILRFKFRGVAAYARFYAEILAKCIDENAISCDSITWVPLSRRRLRRRGYDQARLIAEGTAKRLSLPCEGLLEKRVNNRPQSLTDGAAKRRANVKGVYACRAGAELAGKRVLLIDDIVTSGATLAECALVLKKAGCAEVYAAAAASRDYGADKKE